MMNKKQSFALHRIRIRTSSGQRQEITGEPGHQVEGGRLLGMNRNYHQASESNQLRHSCWQAATFHRLASEWGESSLPRPARPINSITQRDYLNLGSIIP